MLLEERNYYKPFNYNWAFKAYKTAQQMHWMPDEVNLHDDVRDYREKLPVESRRLIDNIFRFFTRSKCFFICIPHLLYCFPRLLLLAQK